MERIGEFAAFGTAVCWTIGALFFERGVKQIGVLSVNLFKVMVAFVLLTITAGLMRGMPLPFDASPHTLIMMSLSGLVGFVITDMFLFSAYGTVGPRIAMLFMALSPPITAGVAYITLGETIGLMEWIGMFLVVSGIFITVFGRQNGISFTKMKKEDRRGYLFAFVASFGQSLGFIISKAGLGDYDPVSGTQIRVFTGILGFLLVSLVYKKGENIKRAIKKPQGLKLTAIGAIFGPYVGVTLSLFAVQRINTGIASTLFGLTPVLIMLPETLIFKKRVKLLEIVGAVVAVTGTAVFFY